MANFKMRANTCTYFKNAGPLASSAQNIDILSGSYRSVEIIKNDRKCPALLSLPLTILFAGVCVARVLIVLFLHVFLILHHGVHPGLSS